MDRIGDFDPRRIPYLTLSLNEREHFKIQAMRRARAARAQALRDIVRWLIDRARDAIRAGRRMDLPASVRFRTSPARHA